MDISLSLSADDRRTRDSQTTFLSAILATITHIRKLQSPHSLLLEAEGNRGIADPHLADDITLTTSFLSEESEPHLPKHATLVAGGRKVQHWPTV